MDKNSEYYQQLQVINQMLEQSSDGPERDELISLKQNIEELLELTEQSLDSTNSEQQAYGDNQDNQNDDGLDDEYAKFMAEMSKEGAIELPNKNFETLENNLESIHIENFKNLEGKKFRAPHKHQWGQVAYHNAMICSVPEDISDISELKVKVLFLNPTHKEMLPCPYYFDLEKDCRFSEEQCRFSHGELVPYSSLQDYVEPKFENLTIGSEVLAKQSDDLWYRGKIAHILKEKCLVKFNSKNIQNVNHEEIIFEHILPLEQSENSSNEESGSESEGVEISEDEESDALKSKKHDELINKSLLVTPDTVPLGDWEKHTKGIGSKLMQKMGYIIGTGLGKEGCGIIKPVTALILPQGKSLDFCMNLKEKSKDPHLFHADNRTKSMKWKEKKNQKKINKGAQQQIKLEEMDLNKYIRWYFCRGKFAIEEKESRLLREKLKIAPIKEVNVTNFVIDKRVKLMTESIEKLKINIQQLEEKHLEPKALYRKLNQRKTDLKRLNIFGVLVQNELDRRKNNKEMAVF